MKKVLKILKVLGLILVVVIVVPIIVGLTVKTFKSVPPPAGELYDVGGYRLHINCIGPKDPSGSYLPTVVVETGAGSVSSLYHWIQQGVSETTQVCLYDRAGLGRSDESGLPRDSETVSKALHALLDKAEIKRPFVFAGHSIAGFYMRQYVELYPGDVAGIAFLDASHPGQGAALNIDMAEQSKKVEQIFFVAKIFNNLGLADFLNLFSTDPTLQTYPLVIQKQLEASYLRSEYMATSLAEMRDFDSAAEQAATNTSLGDRPVVVITAGGEGPEGALPAGVNPEEFRDLWLGLQKEIAALSSNSRHVVVDTADHNSLIIDKANADTVVSYIKEIVMEVAKDHEISTNPTKEKGRVN